MADKQGITFALEGVDEPTFFQVLRDLTHDSTFARPLQLLVEPPRQGTPGRITLAFERADRERALGAMQRFKTILLRFGVQVDSIRTPS
ncbi:hypothetical protein HNR42_002425 [Deinobacterium chartae]|uniref:Uncharacterized protein n=1 Tax=Deinobacterium chartae TaxID=521158 RepID=A0A841I3J5_9DEIO|nr:hypothetical protein [Deinobacterium chartae]MBB6098990.1 hypothetical protein [Deinobacterium chartae]